MITRKKALDMTVKRWTNIIGGTDESGAEDCGFCFYCGDRFWLSCESNCPLRPDVCGSSESAYATWTKNPTKENAMKVLEGVLRKGIPWAEEEEMSECMRKFGVEEDELKYPSWNDYKCIECGEPYGRHYGTGCPDKPKKKEKRPEPKFKVGDRVVIKQEHKGSSGMDSEEVDSQFTIRAVRWGSASWCYDFEGGYGGTEHWLEPAPKEEWVDVTRECEVSKYIWDEHAIVRLEHKGLAVMKFGAGNPWITNDPLYQITSSPTSTYTTEGLTWFKVLRKRGVK